MNSCKGKKIVLNDSEWLIENRQNKNQGRWKRMKDKFNVGEREEKKKL